MCVRSLTPANRLGFAVVDHCLASDSRLQPLQQVLPVGDDRSGMIRPRVLAPFEWGAVIEGAELVSKKALLMAGICSSSVPWRMIVGTSFGRWLVSFSRMRAFHSGS